MEKTKWSEFSPHVIVHPFHWSVGLSYRVRTNLESSWKAIEIDNAVFQAWKVLEKRLFSNWLWKSFGVLLGKILKHPKMDIT